MDQSIALPIKTIRSAMNLPKGVLFCIMYVLNIGVWVNGFALWIKLGYGILVGIVTILGAINQWNTFYKTYKTVWVVVKIEQCMEYILPKKKNRHHKNHLPPKKDIDA